MQRVLQFIRLHPALALGATLTVVLFVALAVGISRKISRSAAEPAAEEQPAASVSEPAQTESAAPVSEPETPVPAPQQPSVEIKPAGLPPTASIDANVLPGAKDSWYVAASSATNLSKAQFARVAGESVRGGLAVFEWPAAWTARTNAPPLPRNYIRFQREGMIRVEAEGSYTFAIEIESVSQMGGSCRLAVGDSVASVVQSSLERGLVAGTAALRPGYYMTLFECSFSPNLARRFGVKVSTMAPAKDQPEIIQFFQLVETADDVAQ